jgi:hypothetical protein
MVADIEDLPTIDAGHGATGVAYAQVRLLVRRAGRPLGILVVDVADGPATAEDLRRLVEAQFPAELADAPPGPLRPGTRSVSVVIPTFRRPDDVERCVASVLATGYPALEVLVVDNCPDDAATAQRLQTAFAGHPRVRLLSEPVPGASRARNRGARAATGDLVAFLDDDVVVDPLWLSALVGALEERPDADCVTGLVLPLSLDTPVQWWFEAYGGFDRGYRRQEFDLRRNPGSTLLYPYTAGALGGLGNVAFRKSYLDQAPFEVRLGPGTPAFGAEDQDALLQLLRGGGRLLYEPAAVVQHRHRDTYAELRWQVFTYGAGFVAALTHWALHDWRVALDLLRRVPPLLPLAFGWRRPGDTDPADLPQLRALERWGYVYGPFAYLRAVAAQRRLESVEPPTR